MDIQSILIGVGVLATLQSMQAIGGFGGNTTWQFDTVRVAVIDVVTGDVVIRSAQQSGVTVGLVNDLSDPAVLQPKVGCADGLLTIKESYRDNNVQGSTHWLITLPERASLETLECHAAMRDVRLDHISSGIIKVYAASGAVTADNIEADSVDMSTTQAALEAHNTRVHSRARYVSADGSVTVQTAILPREELRVASTSGKALLEVEDLGDDFILTAMCNESSGKVRLPFTCSEESVNRIDKHDTFKTRRCVVIRGKGGPKITLVTGDGTAELRMQPQGGK